MVKYKKYILTILLLLSFCISICFVPIDATRFIPALEKQVEKDLGIKVHIEKLIFRFGPSLKIKAPVMHIMYEDGQKFAQFDNVKFFVPWSTLFKEDVVVKRLYADQFILKLKSDDKYLPQLINKLAEKDLEDNPDIVLKKYNISYQYNQQESKKFPKNYKITGSDMEISKLANCKNIKLKAIGNFYINDKQYIAYDLFLQPNFDLSDRQDDTNIILTDILEQVESLDFHADIFADVKISKGINSDFQASGLFNLDNISVLDAHQKEPKSFIYLTFLGNKTRLFSNIYTSSDKKICMDGIVLCY